MISFNEKSHKYVHEETGNVLHGWTSLIKNYTDVFDSDLQKIASAYSMYLGSKEYVALKFGRFKNEPIEEFIKFLQKNFGPVPESYIKEIDFEWSYAAILGSNFHLKLEAESYERGFEINPFTGESYTTIASEKKFDNQSLLDDLYKLEDGYYPELLVWDNTMGQGHTPVTMIDKCFIKTENNIRYVDVDDIKSNKSIWNGKDKKMRGVLSSLYDNTEEKYKLQACFGAKLMSTFGFKPRYCGFTHYKNYDKTKSKLYLAKYDEKLMDNFQNDWKTNIYNTID
jgi:hypothetical protein